jgi:hypothetical protein
MEIVNLVFNNDFYIKQIYILILGTWYRVSQYFLE